DHREEGTRPVAGLGRCRLFRSMLVDGVDCWCLVSAIISLGTHGQRGKVVNPFLVHAVSPLARRGGAAPAALLPAPNRPALRAAGAPSWHGAPVRRVCGPPARAADAPTRGA